MVGRSYPGQFPFLALRGKVIVDTWRGKPRIRAWPRKRGRNVHPDVKAWNNWFRNATALAKSAPPSQQKIAIEATKGTGLYPRDLFIIAMSVGYIDVVDETGTLMKNRRPQWEPVMFQGCILELDEDQIALGETIGAITWPLPILDTGSFFDAANQDRFIIPAHIEVVELVLTLFSPTNETGRLRAQIFDKNDDLLYIATNENIVGQGITLATGPIKVNEGDEFRSKVFVDNTRTLRGNGSNRFTLNVLQAQ